MDGFQLPLCAQLRQALCLLGIGANIWDKCNLPPAASYPVPAFGPQFQKQYSGQVHS